jgi:hypothetical protein
VKGELRIGYTGVATQFRAQQGQTVIFRSFHPNIQRHR